MIKEIIWVGLGGFMGSICRYLVSLGLISIKWNLPWPTLVVNLIGSLVIGILAAYALKIPQEWKLLLIPGFCGGFTTFSSFSLENLSLLQAGSTQTAVAYILSSIIGGLLMVALGFYTAQKFLI